MDKIDTNILQALKKNARASLKDISMQINLSIPSTSERLRKLEQSGIIRGYTVLLDNQKLEKSFTCLCMIALMEDSFCLQKKFRQFILQSPEIVECHCVTGECEYVLKVVTNSIKTLEALLLSFRTDYGIVKSHTYAVLSTVKDYP